MIGGRKGAKAVLSLIFTLVTILGLLFPLIYRGYFPFLRTVLVAAITTVFTISSSMEEIRLQNRDISQKELFLSGIRVGKDMMGTMTNTLILAYVGGSITTLVLNYSYDLLANQLLKCSYRRKAKIRLDFSIRR